MSTAARLSVTRRFHAAPERVFDAWLDPAMVARFLFATPDGERVRVEVDGRVGGGFVVVERRGDVLAEHVGTYVVIDRPHRLVFDFTTSRDQAPTRVTVEIVPAPGGSDLTLSHDIRPEWASFAPRARAGWTAILDTLATTLS